MHFTDRGIVGSTCLSQPYGVTSQDMKAKKRMGLKCIADLEQMAADEKLRLKRVAAVVGGDGSEAKRFRAGGATKDSKESKSASKKAGNSVVVIEIVDEAKGPRKSAVDDISIPYILWGHSQKIQLAGVARSACPHMVRVTLVVWLLSRGPDEG